MVNGGKDHRQAISLEEECVCSATKKKQIKEEKSEESKYKMLKSDFLMSFYM